MTCVAWGADRKDAVLHIIVFFLFVPNEISVSYVPQVPSWLKHLYPTVSK